MAKVLELQHQCFQRIIKVDFLLGLTVLTPCSPKDSQESSPAQFKSVYMLCPFPLALNLSQHQGLFQRVSSSYQVARVSELQLQHQSFQ